MTEFRVKFMIIKKSNIFRMISWYRFQTAGMTQIFFLYSYFRFVFIFSRDLDLNLSLSSRGGSSWGISNSSARMRIRLSLVRNANYRPPPTLKPSNYDTKPMSEYHNILLFNSDASGLSLLRP